MEKWFSYKQSKTVDKSLSYLSGVGEDLSFDISYFLRLSKLAARYYDGALFLNFSKGILLKDREEFGELFERKFDESSHFLFGEKYIDKEYFIYDTFSFVSRFRNTKFDIYEYFDFLFSDVNIRFFNRHLGLTDNIENGIYSVDPFSIYKINVPITNFNQLFAKDNIIGGLTNTSTDDFIDIPKSGGDTYSTEHQVSGIEELKANVHGFKFANRDNNGATIDEDISLATQTINIIVDEQISATNDTPDLLINNNDMDVSTTDTNLDIHDCDDSVGYNDKTAYYSNSLHIGTPVKESYMNNLYDMFYNETPDINLFEELLVGYHNKELNSLENGLMTSSNDKFLDIDNKYVTIGSNSKKVPYIYDEMMVGQSNKMLDISKELLQVGNLDKKFDDSYHSLPVSNRGISADIENRYKYSVSHHEKELQGFDSIYMPISKYEKTLFSSGSNTMLNKYKKSIDGDDNFTLSKYDKSSFMYDIEYVDKYSKSSNMYDILYVNRANRNGIYSTESSVLFKYNRTINDSIFELLSADKAPSAIFGDEGDMIFRRITSGVLDSDDVVVSKGKASIESDLSFDFIARDAVYDTSYHSIDVLVSKSTRSAGGNDLSVLITKSPYVIYNRDTDSWFKKNYREAYEDNRLSNFSKRPYDTSSINSNSSISKARIDTHLDIRSTIVGKNYRATYANRLFNHLKKNYRATVIENTYLWYKLPMRDYSIYRTTVTTYKNIKPIDETERSILFETGHRYTLLNTDDINFDTLKGFYQLDMLTTERPRVAGTDLNEGIAGDKSTVKDFIINPEIHASPIVRDANLDRVSGFGYIEKTDYTLIKDERIDELQLPASDFNYSNFAKKLFVDGSIDVKYIKREDENGNLYINLPIENPIRHFADLATEYIDLNVGMLIYIIEKAYNIWQNKIFTYSAMPSDAALNDILKRLKENLYIQYPSEEDQRHLHRAIRLFRWYAEMSILNNAEYMLKLKYKVLEVDYANQDLSPFSKIATFNNMQIDNTFVLTSTDGALPCSFTMDLTRGHKVRLKFLAAITGGNCVINVNGKENTYTEQMLDFNEELSVGHNVIHISFEPTGVNSYFGIMKLAVEKYTIQSYDISYVGKIGESNPTINHLMNMLFVCGDSIDLVQKTVAHATPTANALDQMRVYFDLHHEDKLKGRRLITKH